MKNKLPASQILVGYDWDEAFKYSNGQTLDDDSENYPFDIEDVDKVLYVDEGANDESHWIIMVKLKNKLYGFLSAWCDYTGWDCQAGGQSYVSKDKKKLIRFGLGEDDRKRFGISLKEDFHILGSKEAPIPLG